MANGGRIDLTVGYKLDKTGLNEIKASIQEIQKLNTDDLLKMNNYPGPSGKQLKQAQSDLIKLKTTAVDVRKAFEDAFNPTTGLTNLQQLNKSLNSIGIDKISTRFATAGKVGQQAFYNIAKGALTTNMQLRQTNTVLDKMGQTFANTLKWGISSSIMNKFVGSVQQAYGYVQHLDASLNDIRIVTGKSADEMDRFAEKANKAAKELGQSTTAYTEASLIYYQQGLSDEEAQARAETTLKAANVTGQTGREVSEQLTAVWNGYKVSAEETEKYVDKLAAVAATTASDLEELSTGMSKVASAANNMGVDIDQLNAQLATIISVTRQAPETAGTALKTIYARMEDLKIGGEDEDGVKLGEVSGTLEKVGISVMDAQGNLRDLGEVIEEVAGKWDTWTSAQQNAIAQSLAGKRQYNNLLALFDNWDMYTEALDTSRNSLGTLQQQQDIYMESTAAHLQSLKTQAEDFYDSLINAKDINTALDGITKLVKGFTTLLNGIGGGKNALLMLGSVGLRVFDKQIGQGIAHAIESIQRMKNNAGELDAQLANIQLFKQSQQYKDGGAVTALVDSLDKVSVYYKVLNNEQINYANSLAQQVADAKELEIQWEQDTEALKEFQETLNQNNFNGVSGLSNKDKKALSGNFDLANGNQMEAREKVIQNMSEDFNSLEIGAENLNKALNKIHRNMNLEVSTSDQWKKSQLEGLQSYQEEARQIGKTFAKIRQSGLLDTFDVDKIDDVENAITRMQNVIQHGPNGELTGKLDDMKTAALAYKDALNELDPEVQEIIQKFFSLNEAGNNVNFDAPKKQLEQFLNQANIQNFTTNITTALSSIGQFSSSVYSLSNAFKILSDDSLTASERIGRFITSVTMGGSMAISSIVGLTKVYKELDKQLAGILIKQLGIQVADEKDITLKTVLTAVSEKLNNAIFKKITGQTGEAAASALVTSAEEGETVAALDLAAANWVLNGSMFPLIALCAAVAGAIAVIATVIALEVKAHKDEVQAMKDRNDAALKASETRREEIKENKEVVSSLEELIDQYKEGSIASEDFMEQKREMISSLDAEARAALGAADSWEEATEALKDYKLQLSKDNIKELERTQEAAFANAQIAMAEQGRGWMSGDKFKIEANSNYGIAGAIGATFGINSYYPSAITRKVLVGDNDKNFQNYMGQQLSQQGLNIEDILTIDNQGRLMLEVGPEDQKTFLAFIDSMEKAQAAGQKIPDLLAQQINEFKASEGYTKLVEAVDEEEAEKINVAGTESGIDDAKTIEEGQAAYEKFKEDMMADGQHTLQETEKAWLTYLSGLDTEVAEQMANVQSDIDIMTSDHFKAANNLGIDTSNWDYTKIAEDIRDYLYSIDLGEGIQLVSPEEWTEWLTSGLSPEQIAEKVKEKLLEEKIENFEELKESAGGITDTVQKLIQEGISGSVDMGEDGAYTTLKEQFETLLEYYPELTEQVETFNNTAIIGTQEWMNAVYDLQHAYNALELKDLTENYSDLLEQYKTDTKYSIEHAGEQETVYDDRGFATTQTVEVEPDLEEFSKAMGDIMDADYAINVEIHADVQDDFDNLVNSMESMDSMASKIGEDFIISAEDITEIAASYPGILEGYTDLGNGTIQLNQDIAESAMQAASQAEIASTEEFVHDVEITNQKLELKKNHYKTIMDISSKAAANQINQNEALSKIQKEFDDIEAINDELVSQAEIDNAMNVADNSNENARIMADNWESGFQKMADASAKSAEIAIENAKAVVNASAGKSAKATPTTNIKTGWTGQSGKSTSIDTSIDLQSASEEEAKAYWNDVYNDAAKNVSAIEQEQAANTAMAIEAAARLGKSVDTNLNAGKKKDDGSGSGSSSEKDADHEDYLEREEDIYKQINEELDQIESTLGRIQTVADHKWGLDAQKALEKENELLDKQLEKLEEKRQLQYNDVARQRGILESVGVTFTEDGSTMTNANAVLDSLYANYNAMVAAYNSMSAAEQETYKAQLEAEKNRVEDIEKKIDTYESSFSDYQSTLDALLDAHYAQIENEVKLFDNMVEVHLELSDARKEWDKFWSEVVEDVQDNDFAGQIAASMKQLKTLVGLGGDVKESDVYTLTQHLMDTTTQVNAQIASANRGGEDSIFGDDTALSKENLQNYIQQLMDAVTAAKEALDNMAENYLKILDDAQDKIDKQIEGWESINDHLEHNLDLIKLISGEKAFDAIDNQLEKQYENNLNLLTTQKASQDFWAGEVKRYETLMASVDKNSKQYQTYEEAYNKSVENYRKAVSDLDKTVETSIKNLQDWRKNAVDNVMDTLDKAMSKGMGLSDMEKQWKLINDYSSRYLDNVERALGMEEYTNILDDAVNATGLTAANQEKLNNFREIELAQLNQKNRLTQYDLDESKARLEILKQQMALEDARNNKSNMRLRRDSQGNYTYQYTGDEEAEDQAEGGLLSARREWYELVKARQKEIGDSAISTMQDVQQALQDMQAAQDANDEIAYANAKERYDMALEAQKVAMEEAEKAKRDFFKGTADYFAEVEDREILPMWEATIEEMVNEWSGGGEESFIGACTKAIQDLEAVQDEYVTKTHQVLNTAGIDYNKLKEKGIDPTDESLKDLVMDNEDFATILEDVNDLLDEQEGYLRDAEAAYNDLETAAVSALTSAQATMEELSRTSIQAVQDIQAAISAASAAYNFNPGVGSNSSSSNGGNGGGPGTSGSQPGGKETLTAYKKWDIGGGQALYYTNINFREFEVAAGKSSDAAAELSRQVGDNYNVFDFEGKKTYHKGVQVYKSGGYTGDWNQGIPGTDNGRLAVLHQKELVLNADDTSNMLKAVEVVRQLFSSDIISGIAQSLLSIGNGGLLSGISSGVQSISSNISNSVASNNSNITINADFSGVHDADEIYEAFTQLQNTALQSNFSTAPHLNISY